MTLTKTKLFLNGFSVCLLAFVIACVFWGKEISASPAGASVRTVVHVLDLVFGLCLILFAGVMVYFAFKREDEEKFGFKAMLLCLVLAAFALYGTFGTFDFIDNLRWLIGLSA